jgi:hypothetical protein
MVSPGSLNGSIAGNGTPTEAVEAVDAVDAGHGMDTGTELAMLSPGIPAGA